MLADGLTKSLGRQKPEAFCSLIDSTDETDLRSEEFRDVIQGSMKQEDSEEELVLTSGGAKLGMF
jgi:hypothetical protein